MAAGALAFAEILGGEDSPHVHPELNIEPLSDEVLDKAAGDLTGGVQSQYFALTLRPIITQPLKQIRPTSDPSGSPDKQLHSVEKIGSPIESRKQGPLGREVRMIGQEANLQKLETELYEKLGLSPDQISTVMTGLAAGHHMAIGKDFKVQIDGPTGKPSDWGESELSSIPRLSEPINSLRPFTYVELMGFGMICIRSERSINWLTRTRLF